MLHFTVTDIKELLYINVRSNNKEWMAGYATIDMSSNNPTLTLTHEYEETPESSYDDNASVTYSINARLNHDEEADIYIPVPVGTYSKGFTVTFSGRDDLNQLINFTKTTEKELVVERATMNKYTEVDILTERFTDVESLLASVYETFYCGVEGKWNSGGSLLNNYVFGDVAGADANKGSTAADQPDFTDIQNFSYNSSNSYILTKWNTIYDAVQKANRLISVVQKNHDAIDDADLMIAQAKFIKAVWLFEGIRMFGAAIPYISVEEYADDKESNIDAAGNYVYIWDKVAADLQDAIITLPATWDNANEGRVTSWMAKAILAKLYLYWSSPYNGFNGMSDHWAEAKLLLEDIINNGVNSSGQKFALAEKYSDLFDINSTSTSSESIFDIEYMSSYYTNLITVGGWGFYQPTYEFVNSFIVDENGLPANDYTSQPPLTQNSGDGSYSTNLNVAVDPRLDYCAGRIGVPYWEQGEVGRYWIRSTPDAGPYVNKKFQAKAASHFYVPAGSSVKHYYVVRFADILLMHAECAIHDGDLARATSDINWIRARAANSYVKNNSINQVFYDMVNGVAKTEAASAYRIGLYKIFSNTSEALTALERERRAEFGMEGHRWFDLARWGTASNVLNAFRDFENQFFIQKYMNKYNANGVTFPIPASIIESANGRIIQNINWL